MDLMTWKRNLLARSDQHPGDLQVPPTIDPRPDSIDYLLEHDGCSGSDLPTEDEDDVWNVVSAGGPARCR
jgi:hypothetical protein